MTAPRAPALTDIVATFFQRLEAMESILRVIVSEARIRALLTLRGDPEKKVLVDLSKFPARVLFDDQARDVDILVTARGEIWHEILSGRMSAGQALGQRELLLKGSASNLARLIPLFDFGPVLYRDHLEKLDFQDVSQRSGSGESEEQLMDSHTFKGEPIPLVRLSTLERLLFGMLSSLSYSLGYLVGLLRYRLLKKLDLFDVLSAMSRGLAAATPQQELGGTKRND
jgi:hypothetical protein